MRARPDRRSIGSLWWQAAGTIGWSPERWQGLSLGVRRLVFVGGWGGLGLVLVALFGKWEISAVVAFALLLGLLVPPFERFPFGRYAVPAAVLGVGIAYPFYLSHLFEFPIVGSFPNMNTMVQMGVFTMMAVGLNMVVGYAGLLDLGYVAFYAVGAYTAAWLASPQFSPHVGRFVFGGVDVTPGIGGIHLSAWLVLIVAGCLTAFAGVVIGLPTLRLRGDYLAIVTLGFGDIVAQAARNSGNLGGFNLTGGPQGITPIDSPGFGHTLANYLGLPATYISGDVTRTLKLFWWTVIALVLLTIFISIRLRDSRLGRAWIAIREDEVAAAAMGVPLMRTKTWSYAAGAFFGGIAGAYYGFFKTGVFPDDFYFNISVFILCMVILGGMGNVWGVIVAASLLAYLNAEGLSNIGAWLNKHVLPCDLNAGTGGKPFGHGCVDVPQIQFLIYGIILVLVMLFRPQGLIPERRRALELEHVVDDEPLPDVTH